VRGPDRGVRKEQQFLYPSEAVQFLACDEVPLAFRRVVALAICLYPRAGELAELRWEDVDLEHGTIHIHRTRDRVTGKGKGTKTGQACRFAIEAALLPLLRAMHGEASGKGRVVAMPRDNSNLCRVLLLWLQRAGVVRAELHEGSATRKNLTFHDLRATAARGPRCAATT